MKSIEGWPEYRAGHDGKIYRVLTRGGNEQAPKIVKPWIGSSGYGQIYMTRKGVRITRMVHRIVAEAWLPNPNGLPEVGHDDENKLNCRPDNLTWQTRRENIDHSIADHKNKLRIVKKGHGIQKEIRQMREDGHTILSISQTLNRSMRYVSQVCNSKPVEISRNTNQGDCK